MILTPPLLLIHRVTDGRTGDRSALSMLQRAKQEAKLSLG